MGGPFDVRHAMQKWMQLQCGDARGPHQCAAVVDENVNDVGAAFVTRHRKCFHPVGRKTWRILFIEGFAKNTVRVPLQRHRPIANLRQKIGSDAPVVVDHIGFGELSGWVKNLLGIRNCYFRLSTHRK